MTSRTGLQSAAKAVIVSGHLLCCSAQASFDGITRDGTEDFDVHRFALSLHERVRAGDATAPNAVAELFWKSVNQWLNGCFPRADFNAVASATTDAILYYLQNPERFEPARGSLETFLRTIAWRKMRDETRRVARRQNHEEAVQPDILDRFTTERACDGNGAREPDTDAIWRQRRELFNQFLSHVTEQERRVMEIWLSGKRSSREFAAALSMSHLPNSQQAAAAYRVKKRLFARARRWASSQAKRVGNQE